MRRLLLSKVPQYLADRATKRLGKSCCSDWPTASDRYIHVHVTRGTLKGVGLEARKTSAVSEVILDEGVVPTSHAQHIQDVFFLST